MITILASLALMQANHPDSLAARVKQLADTYVAAYFERHPDEATLDGVARGPHDRWPDNSPAALARWQQREDAWLERLKRINPDRIAGRPEAVAYGIMRDAIEGSIATRVARFQLWSVAHSGGGRGRHWRRGRRSARIRRGARRWPAGAPYPRISKPKRRTSAKGCGAGTPRRAAMSRSPCGKSTRCSPRRSSARRCTIRHAAIRPRSSGPSSRA